MNKRDLIDGIREINQTAAPQFLAQFDEKALGDYLEHLQAARRKHVTISAHVHATRRPAANANSAVAA